VIVFLTRISRDTSKSLEQCLRFQLSIDERGNEPKLRSIFFFKFEDIVKHVKDYFVFLYFHSGNQKKYYVYFRIRELLRRVSRIAVKSDLAFSIAPFSVGNRRLKLTAGREFNCDDREKNGGCSKKRIDIVTGEKIGEGLKVLFEKYRAYRSMLIRSNYVSFFLSCARGI